MTFTDIITVKDRLYTAFMPTTPLKAALPALSSDPLMQSLYETVASLHYAAFVAVWGPAPDRVNVRCVTVLDGEGGPPRPAYLATLSRNPDHQSVDWFHAFEAGLTSYHEAAFGDPVSEVLEDPSDPESLSFWTVAEAGDVILRACRLLAAEDRPDALRNLATVVPQHIPPHFDPDSPAYNGAARRS